MNIIVTGHKGFIGRNLKQALVEKGHSATGFSEEDLFSYGENWKQKLKKLINKVKPKYVFHVGACSDTMNCDVNYIMFVNYEFTRELVDICLEKNIKIIYSSSSAVYGTDDEKPSNLYGWSKYIAEQYLLARNAGIALRYFNTYGPGEEDKDNMASVACQAFIKYYVDRSITEMKLFPGKPARDFIYVKDVVEANLHAAFKNIKKGYYEVGYGQALPFEDFMDVLKIPYSYHKKSVIPEGYQFYTCSDKKKWMPGWKPKWTFEEAMAEYKDFLEKHFKIKK